MSILTRTTAVRVLSTILGILRTYLFHHLVTIFGMSNNSDTKTSLFFLTFPFLLSPLIFLLLFLPDRYRRTGSYSLGLSRPAHGGPETAPQPFRTCAERRLSEVVLLQLLFFPGVHSGISLLFSPHSRGRFRIGLPGFNSFAHSLRIPGGKSGT